MVLVLFVASRQHAMCVKSDCQSAYLLLRMLCVAANQAFLLVLTCVVVCYFQGLLSIQVESNLEIIHRSVLLHSECLSQCCILYAKFQVAKPLLVAGM
jgi:hypothetical protein